MELSSMDRFISDKKRRRQLLKKVALSTSLPLVLGIGFLLFRNAVKPHLVASTMETAIVEYGNVTESISTSGTVELEKQFTILAPANTVLKSILASPGQQVAASDTLLILDAAPIRHQLKQEQYLLNKLKAKKLQSSLRHNQLTLDRKFNLKSKAMEITQKKTGMGRPESTARPGRYCCL